MNEYTECVYQAVFEKYYNSVITTPDFQMAQLSYDREERALLETLTPEQKKQFNRCKEQETELENMCLKYMFQQTLHFLRGVFCC